MRCAEFWFYVCISIRENTNVSVPLQEHSKLRFCRSDYRIFLLRAVGISYVCDAAIIFDIHRRFAMIFRNALCSLAMLALSATAFAQSTQVTTEYAGSIYLLPEVLPIDSNLRVVNVKPGSYIKGPKISGKVVSETDWTRATFGGVGRLDARFVIRTDDDQLIAMSYNGLQVIPKEALDKLSKSETLTDKEFTIFTIAATFQTSSEKYDWLNKVVMVGKAVELQRLPEAHVKYDLFVVK